jgi:hypothetical protein
MPPLGLLGNIESLVPALAPIAGVGLLAGFGWRVSFEVIALLSLVLAVLGGAARPDVPGPRSASFPASYPASIR